MRGPALLTALVLALGCELDRSGIGGPSDAGDRVDASSADGGLHDASAGDSGVDAGLDAALDAGRDGGGYPEVWRADYDVVVHGGSVRLEGVLFSTVAELRIGGIVQPIRIVGDGVIEVGPIGGATPVGAQPVDLYGPAPVVRSAYTLQVVHLTMSEVDALTDAGGDAHQFIELGVESGPTAPGSLAGYTVVLFGGDTHQAYATFDLAGATVSRWVVLGNASVTPAPSVVIPDDVVGRTGTDAVAIYQGGFAVGTRVTATGLIDAVVHAETTASAPELATTLLLAGAAARVLNEDANGAALTESIQWCSGGRRDARGWRVGAPPTPGVANACP